MVPSVSRSLSPPFVLASSRPVSGGLRHFVVHQRASASVSPVRSMYEGRLAPRLEDCKARQPAATPFPLPTHLPRFLFLSTPCLLLRCTTMKRIHSLTCIYTHTQCVSATSPRHCCASSPLTRILHQLSAFHTPRPYFVLCCSDAYLSCILDGCCAPPAHFHLRNSFFFYSCSRVSVCVRRRLRGLC